MTDHDVFISYARRASAAHARALHRALGEAGITAFLDTDAVEDGDRFPQRLVDGVLRARVFVLFPEPVYFARWYCIRWCGMPLVKLAARVLGEEHPNSVTYMRNLAAVLRGLGDDGAARHWEQRATAAEDQRRQPPGG